MDKSNELVAFSTDLPTIKSSPLSKPSKWGVQCGICQRRCIIPQGKRGFCETKANIDGGLHTVTFGDISACESRPIEIKPFFHFWPGSSALTFSTWGCNFRCRWCQNHHLSRGKPDPEAAHYVPAETMVARALEAGDQGLCASFQEPTLLFEYCLELFPLGKAAGLYTCWVSNGYLTLEALRLLHGSGFDALKIDIKGDADVYDKHCGGVDVDRVWETVDEVMRLGIHVELVTLLIPGVNDSEAQIIEQVSRQLDLGGDEIPLHFTRYHPTFQFTAPPTPIATLERARRIANREGLNFVYLGNVPGHPWENTYCPGCGEAVLLRVGHSLIGSKLDSKDRCRECGTKVPITGRVITPPGLRA